jgi:hypothetical protein
MLVGIIRTWLRGQVISQIKKCRRVSFLIAFCSMLDDLFALLRDPDFQDPEAGLMSFPAYVYVYPPGQEYAFREELAALSDRLQRPGIEQEPLHVNVYAAFLDFLAQKQLGGRSLLSRLHETEPDEPSKVERQLYRHARSDGFAAFLAEQFGAHVGAEAGHRRSYVFLDGWGSMHPYLRASSFLDRMEAYVRGYKLILFYPGTYEQGQFKLFGAIESKSVYRGSCINELIGV